MRGNNYVMARIKSDCVPVAGRGRSFLLGIFRQGKDLLALAGFHGSKPRLALATLLRRFLDLSGQSLLVVGRGPKELGGPEGQRPRKKRRLQQNLLLHACAGDVFA